MLRFVSSPIAETLPTSSANPQEPGSTIASSFVALVTGVAAAWLDRGLDNLSIILGLAGFATTF
jgi:hypothetical protein